MLVGVCFDRNVKKKACVCVCLCVRVCMHVRVCEREKVHGGMRKGARGITYTHTHTPQKFSKRA